MVRAVAVLGAGATGTVLVDEAERTGVAGAAMREREMVRSGAVLAAGASVRASADEGGVSGGVGT